MLDRVDFSQVVAKGKDHTVRASGMQEDLPGSRLASRPLEDFYLMRCQKMIVLHQMVDRLDGQTDVEKPDAVAWMKDNPVMDAVEADIRRLADTIGHSGTKDTAPEIDVAVDIGASQPNIGEAVDAGVDRGKEASRALTRPDDEIDPVARGIAGQDRRTHLALSALGLPRGSGGKAGGRQPRRSALQCKAVGEFDTDRLIPTLAGHEGEAMRLAIGPQKDCSVRFPDPSQPQSGLGERSGDSRFIDRDPRIGEGQKRDAHPALNAMDAWLRRGHAQRCRGGSFRATSRTEPPTGADYRPRDGG